MKTIKTCSDEICRICEKSKALIEECKEDGEIKYCKCSIGQFQCWEWEVTDGADREPDRSGL